MKRLLLASLLILPAMAQRRTTRVGPEVAVGGLTIAEQGITELGKNVDSLITIPNEKLLAVLGGETTLLDAFRSANEVLQGAVQGIAELITRPGLINVDFADVRTVMAEMDNLGA